jgi:hypothetical protein
LLKIAVFWNVGPCYLVGTDRRLRRLQGATFQTIVILILAPWEPVNSPTAILFGQYSFIVKTGIVRMAPTKDANSGRTERKSVVGNTPALHSEGPMFDSLSWLMFSQSLQVSTWTAALKRPRPLPSISLRIHPTIRINVDQAPLYKPLTCETWGSHGGGYEDGCLLGRCAL